MIELPIYHHDEYSKELDELGIKTSIGEADIRMMLFMNISAIGYYKDESVLCSLVHSNGMSFVCPLSYEELKKRLYEGGS